MLKIDTAVRRRLRDGLTDGLKKKIGERRYALWLSRSKPRLEKSGDGKTLLVLGLPSAVFARVVETRFRNEIEKTVAEIVGTPVTLQTRVEPALFAAQRERRLAAEIAFLEGEDESSGAPSGKPRTYTFDGYVVGDSNRLAFKAANKIAAGGEGVYNPLLIYGADGLGKSHLLAAVADELRGAGGRRVVFTNAARFSEGLNAALHRGKVDAFRARHRRAEVLIFDDVHVLSGKTAAQDELLYTFNELSRGDRQIVLASQSHPAAIKKFRKSLASRFVAGLVAEVTPPDYETRTRIAARKAAERGVSLSAGVVEVIAKRTRSSSREVEAAVLVLAAYAVLSRKRLDRRAAAEILDDIIAERSRRPTLENILRLVSEHYGVTRQGLTSRGRSKEVSRARQVAMFLARTTAEYSFKKIGDFFNRRHSTVIFSERKIASDMKSSRAFAKEVGKLSDRVAHL